MDKAQAQRALRLAAQMQALDHGTKANSDRVAATDAVHTDCFDSMISDTGLRDVIQHLYRDKYYANAVEEAYKYLNNVVKQASGNSADGADLMRSTFSRNNPILRLNTLNTQSQRDQQQGYMDILAGCMTGIRNPRAHEHQYLDEPAVALELLVMANHLIRMVRSTTRTRRRRSRAVPRAATQPSVAPSTTTTTQQN